MGKNRGHEKTRANPSKQIRAGWRWPAIPSSQGNEQMRAKQPVSGRRKRKSDTRRSFCYPYLLALPQRYNPDVNEKPSSLHPRYRLVGIRPDGIRTVMMTGMSLGRANSALDELNAGEPFAWLMVEAEPDRVPGP
jgi:hypothetical protein